jgi:PAS domain S-box-containing protein
MSPKPPGDGLSPAAGVAGSRNADRVRFDSTQLGDAEQALRNRSEQLETLINRAPLGVYLVDADFRIAHVNPVALPVFGDIPGGVVGRDFDEVIHILWDQSYADEIVRIFRGTLETGESYAAPERAELRIDRNAVEYYEWRLDRLTLPDGRYGLVCYFRDISEQVRARERATAAESESRERAEVLARLYSLAELCAPPNAQTKECLEEALALALWITGAHKGTVHLHEDEHGTLDLAVHKGLASVFVEFFKCVTDEVAAAFGVAFHSGARVIVEDITTSPIFAGKDTLNVLLGAGIRAVQSTPLRSGHGHVVGIVSTHFDKPHRPTERQCAYLDLLARQAADFLERKRGEVQRAALLRDAERARAEAEEANRSKDEFLATVSHELRSPLQGILGWLSLLRQEGGLEPEQRTRALESVERSIRLHAQLVHDIMDISRIVAGKVKLDRAPLDLSAVVESTADEFIPGAIAKSIELSVVGGHCGIVLGDRERLHQVIANLLSNALKFTPPGGRITLTCARENGQCIVNVTDTGEGVEGSFLPRIFDRFTQADASSTRRHGGLGLGLAIVKHLVELHGGTVSAASEGRHRGATFEVRLPEELPSTPPQPLAAPSTEPPPTRLDGVEILLVEDDLDSLEATTLALRAAGALVRPAASASEAWSAYSERAPDIVVSDLSMPEEDGYSLLRRIRQLDERDAVPAIALTGFTRPEDKARVLAAGFAAHVPKPVELEVLLTVLTQALAGHSPTERRH